MKRIIESTNGITELNTSEDPCIYASARYADENTAAYMRGRDLHVYEEEGQPNLYYIHGWSKHPEEEGFLNPITEAEAERFLEERGFALNSSRTRAAANALRNYGYGILEEF